MSKNQIMNKVMSMGENKYACEVSARILEGRNYWNT